MLCTRERLGVAFMVAAYVAFAVAVVIGDGKGFTVGVGVMQALNATGAVMFFWHDIRSL